VIQRFVALAIALLVSMAVVSCKSPETIRESPAASSRRAATSPASQPSSGSHWIQDQRLRLLMAELSKQNPSWRAGRPQEPENPAAATQPYQFDEIAVFANALAEAADHLPSVTGHIPLSPTDRAGFLAEARTLHEQAVQLQSAANHRNIEQMQLQMDRINSSCISCHSHYRDFAGQLVPL